MNTIIQDSIEAYEKDLPIDWAKVYEETKNIQKSVDEIKVFKERRDKIDKDEAKIDKDLKFIEMSLSLGMKVESETKRLKQAIEDFTKETDEFSKDFKLFMEKK